MSFPLYVSSFSNDFSISLVGQIESLRRLRVQLDGAAFLTVFQSITNGDVNIASIESSVTFI